MDIKKPPLVDMAGPAHLHLTHKMTHSEVLQTFRACQSHGGSFMRSLATAGLSADPENVQVARLQIDVMKWTASKFKQKRYGDKLQTDNTNRNLDIDSLTDEELDAKLRQLNDSI